MSSETAKHLIRLVALVGLTAIVLSLAWHVPYIVTVIGFSAWAFIGHLITADDDAPRGWSNPAGALPFPWVELVVKALVLVVLCALAVCFPAIRSVGGAP